jgi:hypothetical protein
MADQLLVGTAVVLLPLLYLRFGDGVCDAICSTLDPAPEIIEKYQP